MTQPERMLLDALPVEIYLQIVENALIASPEHAETDNAGHYAPSKFDMTLLDVNQQSQNMLVDRLSRGFAFIEDFADAFSLPQHRKMLEHTKRHAIPLSTIRLDLTCADCLCAGSTHPEILIFTEATPFADLMMCAMLQHEFNHGNNVEVTLSSHSRTASTSLLRSLNTMKKYLRVAQVTQVNGVGERIAQDFIRAVNAPLTTLGGFITIWETHIQDLQRLHAAELSYLTMLPIAVRFLLAHDSDQLEMVKSGFHYPEDCPILTYLNSLRFNTLDIAVRGFATYLLARPADYSHYLLTELPGPYSLSRILRDLICYLWNTDTIRRKIVLPVASAPTSLNRSVQFEELYKSQTLLELALARLRLCSETTICDNIRNDLDRNGLTTSELLQEFGQGWRFGDGPDGIGLHVLKPLELKTKQYWTTYSSIESVDGSEESSPTAQSSSTNAAPESDISGDTSTATGDNNALNDLRLETAALQLDEIETYDRTRIWLQQAHLIHTALKRAHIGPEESREEAMAIIREPILHSAALWGDGDQEDQHLYLSLQGVPEPFKNNFPEKLKEMMMGEYQLPFPVSDEQRREAHDELRRLGYEI